MSTKFPNHFNLPPASLQSSSPESWGEFLRRKIGHYDDLPPAGYDDTTPPEPQPTLGNLMTLGGAGLAAATGGIPAFLANMALGTGVGTALQGAGETIGGAINGEEGEKIGGTIGGALSLLTPSTQTLTKQIGNKVPESELFPPYSYMKKVGKRGSNAPSIEKPAPFYYHTTPHSEEIMKSAAIRDFEDPYVRRSSSSLGGAQYTPPGASTFPGVKGLGEIREKGRITSLGARQAILDHRQGMERFKILDNGGDLEKLLPEWIEKDIKLSKGAGFKNSIEDYTRAELIRDTLYIYRQRMKLGDTPEEAAIKAYNSYIGWRPAHFHAFKDPFFVKPENVDWKKATPGTFLIPQRNLPKDIENKNYIVKGQDEVFDFASHPFGDKEENLNIIEEGVGGGPIKIGGSILYTNEGEPSKYPLVKQKRVKKIQEEKAPLSKKEVQAMADKIMKEKFPYFGE